MLKVSVAGKTLADFPDLVKQIDREKRSLVSQLTDFENNKQQWNMKSIKRTTMLFFEFEKIYLKPENNCPPF